MLGIINTKILIMVHFITFVGIIRDENQIDGLSFDLYEPILKNSSWQDRAKERNAIVFLAHSQGDV